MPKAGHRTAWYWVAIALLKPPTALLTRRELVGREHVPGGGVILAVNHISAVDPVVFADMVLFGLRRTPRFLAKSTLFRPRSFVGSVMRGAGQIPVERGALTASESLAPALAALRAGEAIALYPEGTVTRDPGKWPMRARTGVARLALGSGAPVVPIAQWGAQRIHDTYREPGLHLWPPTRVRFRVGPPVDLRPWRHQPLTTEVLQGATAAVMDAITVELEALRDERAPKRRHDPGRDGRSA